MAFKSPDPIRCYTFFNRLNYLEYFGNMILNTSELNINYKLNFIKILGL